MTTRPFPAVITALMLAVPAGGQTSIIDEGSFRLLVDGSTIGTETFTIRRSGSGANASITAQGRVILDTGERTHAVVEFRGRQLRPTAFQIEVTGTRRQNISGRATGNRFRATSVSPDSERMREYRVEPGAVVLDDGITHQHYFIAAAADDGSTIPVIIPRLHRQLSAQVQDLGSEPIDVGDRQTPARRLSIEISGMDPRTVWVDDRNRVLRLHIPAQNLLAIRTSRP